MLSVDEVHHFAAALFQGTENKKADSIYSILTSHVGLTASKQYHSDLREIQKLR
jgi:hypothetical protein